MKRPSSDPLLMCVQLMKAMGEVGLATHILWLKKTRKRTSLYSLNGAGVLLKRSEAIAWAGEALMQLHQEACATDKNRMPRPMLLSFKRGKMKLKPAPLYAWAKSVVANQPTVYQA